MLKKLKSLFNRIKSEIKVYELVLKDKRTPKLAKILLGIAIGYLVFPIDIIPDFIPVLGHLDDLLIVPGLVIIAVRMIPKDIIAECRERAKEEVQK